MQFEIQRGQGLGGAIAAPVCPAYDRGAAFFQGLGRSWNRVNGRADRTRVLWRAGEYTGRRYLAKDRDSARRAEIARTNFAGPRAWISSTTSILTELWSRMLREREIRRIRAAWRAIDDRTLKDIGVSRYEIEYAGDRRHCS
jgi:uncharacterized protein YjiS (DUF1127 family)